MYGAEAVGGRKSLLFRSTAPVPDYILIPTYETTCRSCLDYDCGQLMPIRNNVCMLIVFQPLLVGFQIRNFVVVTYKCRYHRIVYDSTFDTSFRCHSDVVIFLN